ncbi:transglycosylase family protein [Lactovum odontotermitis]
MPHTVSADDSKAVTAETTQNLLPAQPIVRTQDEINQEALLVIHGDLGNGDERVQKLTEAGFDVETVQNQVNSFYQQWGWSGAYAVADQTIQSMAEAGQTNTNINAGIASTSSNATPAADTNSSMGTDVVSYAANKMAANTGVSAAEWTNIIMAESSGNPSAVNSSSGAYGLLQLLGHGEYPGMSVDEQIAMATQVYQSQGLHAWVVTW